MAEQVQTLFTQLLRQYRSDFRHQLENEITSPQLHLLELLNNYGPQKMSDLAEKMFVTVGAITLLGDRLINAGYAQRQRSQSDRRVVLLSITERGRELAAHYQQIRNQVLQQFFGKLTSDELDQLGQLCRKMLDV